MPTTPHPADAYRPGSFGCHELLDRVSLVGDLVEERILNHPACAADPAWRAIAARAADALRDLYQAVGAAHVAADDRA